MEYPSIVLPNVGELFQQLINNDEAVSSFGNLTEIILATSRNLWCGDITPEVGVELELDIRFWNMMDDNDNIPIQARQPIVLNVCSNGGDLDAAFMIADAISMSCTPVFTVNTGYAYSGGAFVAMSGWRRYCYPHATYMLHEGSIEGVAGDAHKFRNFNDFYKKRIEQIKRLVTRYTSITEEEYEKQRKDDWWFTADEAIEFGLVDEIITSFPTIDGKFNIDRGGWKF